MPRNQSTEELEQIRLLAARMLEEGLEPVVIARILQVDDQSVRRWDRIRRARGIDGLKGSKPPGAKRRLTDEQRQQIPQLLAHPPQHYQLEGWLWTSKLVGALIEQRFGVRYHHDHVSCLLRELGLSYQRPARRAKERDEQQIEQWRQQVWPELLKKTSGPAERSSLPTKSAS
jgi:transposase